MSIRTRPCQRMASFEAPPRPVQQKRPLKRKESNKGVTNKPPKLIRNVIPTPTQRKEDEYDVDDEVLGLLPLVTL